MRAFAKISILTLALTAVAADAAETITYTYDARGRLVSVSRSGSVNNGANTAYAYDKTDNRTTVTTTGGGGGMALVAPPAATGPAKTPTAGVPGAPK